MKHKRPDYLIITFESLTANSAGGIGKVSYALADFLRSSGSDLFFYTINKGPHKTSFPSKGVHWSARYFLFILNFLVNRGMLSKVAKRRIEENYFDFFLSKQRLSADYLITTSAYIPRTLKKYKHNFKKVVYIPATPNELKIFEVCEAELSQISKTLDDYEDAYTDRKRLSNFRDCLKYIDQIISISPITTKSFADTGIDVVEIPFVHTPPVLPIAERKEGGKIVFLYLAYSVLLKGLHRLLKEWEAADLPDAEPHIVGDIQEQYSRTFELDFKKSKNIKVYGYVPDTAPYFANADVLLIPSLIDNEPSTATEALALGKPVLISDTCGYARFIGEALPEAVFDINKEGEPAGRIRAVAGNLELCREKYKQLINYVRSRTFDADEFHRSIITAVTGKDPG